MVRKDSSFTSPLAGEVEKATLSRERGTKLPFKKLLRLNQTDTENIFWYHFRAKRFQGFKFRRQVQIENYIVDFVCYERNLIIEFDGGQHNDPYTQEYDHKRTTHLEKLGFSILRFWNNEALVNQEAVLEEIEKYLVQ